MRVNRLIIGFLAVFGAVAVPVGLVLPAAASARAKHAAPNRAKHAKSSSECPPSGATGNGSSQSQGNSGSGGSGMSGTSGQSSNSPGCTGGSGMESGGASTGPPPPGTSTPSQPTVTGFEAKIINGVAYAPSYAPLAVKKAIWAGNKIRKKPYIYGGGHGSFNDSGYDCSGSVSYVLHAAGLLDTPMDSSTFEGYGQAGLGHWITIFTNPGHAFVEIAGIRFDTSAEADPNPAPGSGPRWRPLYPHPQGFDSRHPRGM